jgi:hypothetical protein
MSNNSCFLKQQTKNQPHPPKPTHIKTSHRFCKNFIFIHKILMSSKAGGVRLTATDSTAEYINYQHFSVFKNAQPSNKIVCLKTRPPPSQSEIILLKFKNTIIGFPLISASQCSAGLF